MSHDYKPPHKGLDYQGRYEDIEQPAVPRWAVYVSVGMSVLAIVSAVVIALGY